MFEIHRRQTPMFVTSEVKLVAQVTTRAFELDEEALREFGIEIYPIFQTVRINENNQLIVKSGMSPEKVVQTLEQNTLLRKLRECKVNPAPMLESLAKNMIEILGVDSYFCIGDQVPMIGIENILSKATRSSKKPVLIFTSENLPDFQTDEPWFDLDHPAIWLTGGLGPNMADTEAFFAVSPALKLDVGLNRYRNLESFGSFAVGMVRL